MLFAAHVLNKRFDVVHSEEVLLDLFCYLRQGAVLISTHNGHEAVEMWCALALVFGSSSKTIAESICSTKWLGAF